MGNREGQVPSSRGLPRGGTLGDVLAQLDVKLFVGREAELSIFRDWLTDSGAATSILHVWGPGGIGKSSLMRAFEREAVALGRAVLHVDGREIPQTPNGLLNALAVGPLDQAVDELNSTRPVLLIDTFEALGDLTHFLQHDFLPRLGAQVRVVLAGREMLGLAWEKWRPLVRSVELAAFSPSAGRAFLARRGVDDDRLVAQLLRTTRRHPLAMSLAIDLVQQTGVHDLAEAPEWRRLVHWLIEQLLADVRDPVLRELLQAGAIVRQFDEASLAAIAGRDDIAHAFDSLCGLSIVRPALRGLRLHDEVRHIMVEDLRWRHASQLPGPAEREWLLAERLALWENAFIQTLLFTEEEEGRVFLDWAGPDDRAELARVWAHWLDNWLAAQMRLSFDRDLDRATLEAVLDYPATRVRVARDRDGRVVGFGTALPMCRESLPLIQANPALAPLATIFATRTELPATAELSNAYYFFHLAHTDVEPIATQQALIRDVFGLFARGGTYLVSTPVPEYKTLFTSLGFELIPEAQSDFWSDEHHSDGFVLDLTRVGVEPWLEAIVAGRSPPRSLALNELEQALHEVLVHWHNDARLVESPMAAHLRSGSAAAMRDAVVDALNRLRAHAPPQSELAFTALERAYFGRTQSSSHERLAEELAVSRSTFYRLLRRAEHDVATALAANRVE